MGWRSVIDVTVIPAAARAIATGPMAAAPLDVTIVSSGPWISTGPHDSTVAATTLARSMSEATVAMITSEPIDRLSSSGVPSATMRPPSMMATRSASRASVWEEVRRLNDNHGVTIFLTTQYLEEADELADRVAIIDGGRIVAEGTPDELKRSIGSDVIIATVSSDIDRAKVVAATVDSCGPVEIHGSELTIVTSNGAASIGPVAIALAAAGITVTSMTLRRPTLDDVFLELTGAHL